LGSSSESGPTVYSSKPGCLDQNDDNDERIESNDDEYETTQPAFPVIVNENKSNHFQLSGSGNRIKNIKNIKRSNKLLQALNLPTIMNVNPRSIYNKKEEFHTFVEE
jgi:hypothetical protein